MMYQAKLRKSIRALRELKLELEAKFIESEITRMYYDVKLREVEHFLITLENMLLIAD